MSSGPQADHPAVQLLTLLSSLANPATRQYGGANFLGPPVHPGEQNGGANFLGPPVHPGDQEGQWPPAGTVPPPVSPLDALSWHARQQGAHVPPGLSWNARQQYAVHPVFAALAALLGHQSMQEPNQGHPNTGY